MGKGSNDVTQQNAKSNAKTSQTNTYTPAGMDYIKDLIGEVNRTAKAPYEQITQGIAGFTPEQNAAIGQLQSLWGQTQPYLQDAAQMFQDAATPLSQDKINAYYNPYADKVGDFLKNTFNEQFRDITGKLTGAAGGVGGDRIAVGQAEALRQNQLAAGVTAQQMYESALSHAQQQQGIEQASGYGLGNLGTSYAQIGANLANQLFGYGTAEQQTQQAALNADYAQKMAAAGYKYQVPSWVANLLYPGTGQMGGTSVGRGNQVGVVNQTTNPPNPSPFGAIAGGALTGLSVAGPYGALAGGVLGGLGSMFKRGGRVGKYATGGSPYGGGYIPAPAQMNMGMAQQPQFQPMQFANMTNLLKPAGGQQSTSGFGGVAGMGSNVLQNGANALRGAWNKFSGGSGPEGNMGWTTSVSPAWGGLKNMFSGGMARGGQVSEPHNILMNIARGKGGKVEGFAYGGSPYKTILDRVMPGVISATPDDASVIDMPAFGESIAQKNPLSKAWPFAGAPKPKGTSQLSFPPDISDLGMSFLPPMREPSAVPGMDSAQLGLSEPNPNTLMTPGSKTAAGKVYGPNPNEPRGPQGPLANSTLTMASPGELPETDVPHPGPQGAEPEIPPPPQGADVGPGGPGGHWAQAIGSVGVPPYSPPTLFGHPLSNMDIALLSAGLGMMASNSPYGSVQVGEGGLKGVEALKDFQKMDADRQAKVLDQMLQAGQLDVSEGNLALQQSMRPSLELDALEKAHDRGDISDETYNRRLKNLYARNPELTGGYPGEQDTGVAAPAAPAKPETVDVTTEEGDRLVYPKPAPREGTNADYYVDTKAVPANPDQYNKSIYGRAPNNPNVKAQAKASVDEIKKLDDAASDAADGLRYTYEANKYLGKLNGYLSPGWQFANRTELGNIAQTIESIAGITGDHLDQLKERVGNAQAVTKLQTYAGFNLSRTLGTREAMQIIQQALAAVYGGHLSPDGARNIIYSMEAKIQRNADEDAFVTNWAANSPSGITRGARSYFDNYVGTTDKYLKRIETLKKLNKAAPNMTPEERQKFADKYEQEYGYPPDAWNTVD